MHALAGRPKSEEHRRKLAEAMRGRKQSTETIAKRVASNRGFCHTAESRAKIAATRRRLGKLLGRLGAKNHKWKGGRRWAKGYVTILDPGHPNAGKNGYVGEHVRVMSEHLGRPIGSHETVHHINGIKDDNRLENLVVMSRAEHASHHHKGLMKPASLANLRPRRKAS